MIRHFLRLVIQRNFKRNGFVTVINILGLSVGLTSFILFVLFLQKIKDYDSFHENYNKIYRVISENKGRSEKFCGTPAQLGSYLAERIPEIEKYVRINEVNNIVVTQNEEKFFESDLIYTDNSFFEVFSFPIIQGNKIAPIENISSVVITKKMAQKYFGATNPIGQVLKIGKSERNYTVTAVIQDCPINSSIKFDFILSFERFDKDAYWGEFNYYTYLLLASNKQEFIAEKKIKECAVDRGGDKLMSLNFLRLQALKNLRFEPVRGNTFKTIDRKYIYIFLVATIFILFLAIINYTNLSSAVALRRSKELAIKKISGSRKRQIIAEFLAESVLFTLIALVLALILIELISPGFGQLINEEIQLSYELIPYFILISIFVGITAGIYPSLYGTKYGIIELLKESFFKGRKAKYFRNALVMIQFGITSFLLICAITFSSQLNFMFNREIGINPKDVYEIEFHWDGIKLNELKNELKEFPGIENVSTSTFSAGEDGWNQSARWEGMVDSDQINMFVLASDKDFVKTLGIKFLEKLDDYDDMSFSGGEYYIINKSAKDYIGWKEANNKLFTIFSDTLGRIVGVVEDFNFRSLHHASSPSVILVKQNPISDKMHVKVKPGYQDEFFMFLEKKWKDFAPVNAPLIITDLKQDFENLYSPEKKTQKVIILFTIIAIFISMLGLLGLATFITLQRTKEIGIRKVLGSGIFRIIILLVVDFVKWVFIAFFIALPLAYLYIQYWLQNFSYHININIWTFILAGSFILLIAFLTVLILVLRATFKNPVDSLRYE